MGGAARPDTEAQGLTTLMCLRILDTPQEERFDRITRLVAAPFGISIAAINPLVTGEPSLRFYAGVPLRSAEGYVLGTLCIEYGSPFPGDTHPAMVTLRTGEAQEGVVMGLHKPDGALTRISVNAHPLCHPDDDTPRGVACSFVDSTQHKANEAQLTAYQHQLEGHNAALTMLATTDGMTGVTNKRTMLGRLAAELDVARQLYMPLSLVW